MSVSNLNLKIFQMREIYMNTLNSHFVDLGREVQDEIISRTERDRV